MFHVKHLFARIRDGTIGALDAEKAAEKALAAVAPRACDARVWQASLLRANRMGPRRVVRSSRAISTASRAGP